MKIKYNTKNKKNFRNKILITKNNYGEDGVGHIRIGLNSETVLGNMLDIEFNLPFLHPYLGHFNSVEGFWNYITVFNNNQLVEEFRDIPGHKCKKLVNKLNKGGGMSRIKSFTFKSHIYNAMYLKIIQNEFLFKMITESELPFKQYVDIRKNKTGESVLVMNSFQNARSWILDYLEDLRIFFKQNKNLIDKEIDSNNEIFYYKEHLPMRITNKDYNNIHGRMKDYHGFYLKE